MISVIVTAYKEEKTIGKAIEAILGNNLEGDFEIIIVSPDDATKKVVDRYVAHHKMIKHIRDPGKGKPVAINIALQHSKGDLLILTDGDVYISKNAISELLQELQNKKTGAVTARPISISPKKTLLGYWSHLLTDAGAHLTRLQRVKRDEFIVVSGYLFAMKRLFSNIPDDALSDDAIMSQMIWKKGYTIGYAEKALVYVKYPSTFKDWVLQKKRSTGGYKQIKEYFGKDAPRMRSFGKEVIEGTKKALYYPQTVKEFFYTLLLFPARLYLWFVIFVDLYIRNKKFHEIWKRVETTK